MIFVDSGFLLALAQPADALHQRAVAWSQRLSEPLLVTEHVLCETVNHLSKIADRARAHRIVDRVNDSNYTVVHASPELFAAGLQLHRNRPDKEWSLTDCISFHVMRERGVTRPGLRPPFRASRLRSVAPQRPVRLKHPCHRQQPPLALAAGVTVKHSGALQHRFAHVHHRVVQHPPA